MIKNRNINQNASFNLSKIIVNVLTVLKNKT